MRSVLTGPSNHKRSAGTFWWKRALISVETATPDCSTPRAERGLWEQQQQQQQMTMTTACAVGWMPLDGSVTNFDPSTFSRAAKNARITADRKLYDKHQKEQNISRAFFRDLEPPFLSKYLPGIQFAPSNNSTIPSAQEATIVPCMEPLCHWDDDKEKNKSCLFLQEECMFPSNSENSSNSVCFASLDVNLHFYIYNKSFWWKKIVEFLHTYMYPMNFISSVLFFGLSGILSSESGSKLYRSGRQNANQHNTCGKKSDLPHLRFSCWHCQMHFPIDFSSPGFSPQSLTFFHHCWNCFFLIKMYKNLQKLTWDPDWVTWSLYPPFSFCAMMKCT